MLTMVEARTVQGDLLSLSLQDLSDGIAIEDIEGLGPVKATIVSSSFATLDGVQYQSSKREPRDVKFKFGLEPDYVSTTVEDVRNRLYKFFMPKSQVDLRFILSSGLEVDISGRVETCEPSHFSKEPGLDVSVFCSNPDFYDRVPVEFSGQTVSDTTETPIVYEGSIETGINFVLNVNRTISEFTIYHRPPDNSLRTLEFATPLSAGDVLAISTVPGAKGATLTTAGVTKSVLYGVSPQSNWIELMPGTNNIRVYAEGVGIPFDIEYINKYGGL